MDLPLSFGLESTRTPRRIPSEQKMIIIGAGPAGLTAAVYAARAALGPLLLTGPSLGGQAAGTSEMENYPGFPEGISGFALAQQMQQQAERFGATISFEQVSAVEFGHYPFAITTDQSTYKARTVVIATGTEPRRLGIPGEKEFTGRGVSYCATCDGAFYRGKTVVVVGGGNSALDEGLFLTRFANKVKVIHRRGELRADAILRERAFENPRMDFVWNSVVEEIYGDQSVSRVRLRRVDTGETLMLETDGVFIYIGLLPQTELFKGQVDLDEQGYIITDKRQRTSVPGVFSAGDVQDPVFRQVVIAAGTGAAAAIEADHFLSAEDR